MSRYRRMICLGLGTLAALACVEGRAQARTVVAHATVNGHDVPVYRVGEWQAADTPQGIEGFAIQVAYVLRDWTREHGVEAIGNLCRTADGSRWGTVLLTIDAHIASPVTNACPDGMRATGVDIHSHPQHQHYRANAIDRLFLRRNCTKPITTSPDTFSADDYAHPGYMVGATGLHYQHGRGSTRIVQALTAPPAERIVRTDSPVATQRSLAAR